MKIFEEQLQIKLNNHGYYELLKKPDEKELAAFYRDKYFQENKKPHHNNYSEKELLMINNKIEQKYLVTTEILGNNKVHQGKEFRLLDIGCGEGWTLSYFRKQGWEVTGLDYSSFGCSSFNPHCMDYLLPGDIYENIKSLIIKNEKFDLIWMTNVLEHVLDPEDLLIKSKKLINEGGILIVQVPNDFSELQIHLLENGFIDSAFWVISPDHISYFGKESLINLMKHTGWRNEKMLTDFPIDFNLFNENTNYIMNKNLGKSVHFARVEIENFLHKTNPEKTNKLYELLAEMNIGRQIIGFFSA